MAKGAVSRAGKLIKPSRRRTWSTLYNISRIRENISKKPAFNRKRRKSRFSAVWTIVDFWRKSNKPPFDFLQSFLGFHFTSGIIATSAASPDRTKNQPIGS
jgi:hypothetical protein